MKNQEWTENGRKLNLCAADDERLKTLLEKDVKVLLCTTMYRCVQLRTVMYIFVQSVHFVRFYIFLIEF